MSYSYNDIEIIIAPEVAAGLPKSAEPELVRSISSFIEAGFIVENDTKSVIVDLPLLHRIVEGSEVIRTYSQKYGTDKLGFVLYSKWVSNQ
jgi:hypothetical protein